MGKFSQGIFGNFYGKIGQVVGSTWRGIDYMRSMPRVNKNRVPTGPQLEQQARFALMTAFLNPLRDVLDVGYKKSVSGPTAYNEALSDNIKTAISGMYPAIAVDYALVKLSNGIMQGGGTPAVAAAAGRVLNFSWTDNTGKGKAKATDKAVVLVFCPELNEGEYSIGQATRADEALSMTLSAEFEGKEVHTWIFWAAATGNEVTATAYTGEVAVLN